MAWDYKRLGENGRLYSYYGKNQEWTYEERGQQHTIKVVEACPKESGVQYFLISNDGKLDSKLISAARLHYVLHQKQAKEVKRGTLIPFPLLIDEVKVYFMQNDWTTCGNCGGNGIDDHGKICRCAERLTYEIKNYNADKRLAKIKQV